MARNAIREKTRCQKLVARKKAASNPAGAEISSAPSR